jgi:putative SOS response-associated peptidase YedK
MCGRFTLATSLQTIQERFLLNDEEIRSVAEIYTPNLNIAPTQMVLTVTAADDRKRLQTMRWGLIPFWSKDIKIGVKLFNARAETLREKPSFRHLLSRKRCLIVADGFYEFREENKKKIPVKFSLISNECFTFAGLFDVWKDKTKPDKPIISCTLITTEPNTLVASVHNRMPVILKKEDEPVWLDPLKQHYQDVHYLLTAYDDHRMIKTDVDPDVTKSHISSKAPI